MEQKHFLANKIDNILANKGLVRDYEVETIFHNIFNARCSITLNHNEAINGLKIIHGGAFDASEFDQKHGTDILRAHRYALVGIVKALRDG